MGDQPSIQIQNTPPADHDLLIRLDTKFDILDKKFDELADNLVDRVETLEKEAAAARQERGTLADQLDETRHDVKVLNRYSSIAIGALLLLQLYFVYKQAFPNH